MTFYIGLIHKEPSSIYGISFPDFPGCISAGETFEAVIESGREALSFHREAMLADGEPSPPPSSVEDVMSDPGNQSGVPVLIQLDGPIAQAA